MIFITTENLLNRFNIPFEVTLKDGRKQLSIQSELEGNQELVSDLCIILNARLSGDSINYELTISKCISKFSNIDNGKLYLLLSYLTFESGLTNSAFENDKSSKKALEFKKNIHAQIKNQVIKNDLIVAICCLDSIFNNDSTLASELSLLIKKELNLKIALQAFLSFQLGNVTEALSILEGINSKQPDDIFLHLCINLKTFSCIKDGRFDNFKSLSHELKSLRGVEASHLAPLIQSNLLYLSSYNNERSWNTDAHYKNVLLYHLSRELDLLDKLKSGARRLTSDEVYENMEVYGKETIRFNNTPNAIGRKLFKYIFWHSFMGYHSGHTEGSKLFLQSFYTLGDMYKDQTLYREALRNAVNIGSSKDIEKVIRTPTFIKSNEAISYIEKMISSNPYQGATAIGVSYLIKNTYPFITDRSALFVVSHIKKEIQNVFSFTSDFDHARPALEALYFASHTLPTDKAIELYYAFSSIIEKIPLNMIGLDAINKVVNNLPKSVINEGLEPSSFLINFYFKILDNAIKMHYEMTLLSLSWLIRNSTNTKPKSNFLDILKREISNNHDIGTRKVFLLDIQREVVGFLSSEQATDMANLVIEKILSPTSDRYSTEGYSSFDNLLISTKSFDFMPQEIQDKYVAKLQDCLLDNRASISTKTSAIQAINFLSKKLDKKYFEFLDDFISRNKNSLFASSQSEDLSPFRNSSFVNFRALLYSCAANAPVKNPISLSLDLLRLSVSTDSHVRILFAETIVSFIQSNPNCSGNLSLLHRCYELTFDSDPKVRGVATSSIIELFKNIDQEIKETYQMRIMDLSSDSSEITRAYLALSLNKFKANLPSEVFNTLKSIFENDVSFYVRRNINEDNNEV